METGYPHLKGYMAEHDIKVSDLAKALSYSPAHVYNILSGRGGRGTDFNARDLRLMAEVYEIHGKEFDYIFFGIKVTRK